jgi:5-methylcytosine-specific restriction endonuclease McrA
MNGKVLILNQDYSALTICTAEKAFILMYLNKAELVLDSATRILRSVNKVFAMPSVIRLGRYVHIPYKGVVLSRQNIFKRDENMCQYCKSKNDLTLDHVQPRSRGGKSSWLNLITACKPCNSRKGDRTPEEANMIMFKKPFKPSFIMFLREFSGKVEPEWEPFLGKKNKNETEFL